MGRHSAAAEPRRPVAAIVAILALVVALAGVAIYRAAHGGQEAPVASSIATCPTTGPAADIAVAPAILGVVTSAASRVTAKHPCRTYALTSAEPATTAGILRGDGPKPDAWVSDSPVWTDAVRAARPGTLATGDQPLAVSPLVLAVPTAVTTSSAGAGASVERATWKSVLTGTSGLTVTLTDPDLTTSGRLVLLSAPGAVGTASSARTDLAKILLGWSHAPTRSEPELFATLTTGAPAAFPASEQAVTTYGAKHPGVVSSVIPAGGTFRYTYSLVSVAGLSPDANASVDALRQELASPTTRDALAVAGFRADDSADGTGVTGVTAAPVTYLPVVPAATRTSLLQTWQAVRTDARMLALIDASGSMGEKVGGETRMQLATGAAAAAVGILPPATEVGTWAFGIDKGGPGQDWVELAPIRRLDRATNGISQRDLLTRILPGIAGEVGGGTGLYDSVFAAYQQMVGTYQVGRANSVVVLTDGRNEDPVGLTLEQLLRKIDQVKDPSRPVVVITIGMGTDVDIAALHAISTATGGTSYVATNPQDIGGVFIDAILARRCTVANCAS